MTGKENLAAGVPGGGRRKAACGYFWKLRNILELSVKLCLHPTCQLASLVISATHQFSRSRDPTEPSAHLLHKRLHSASRHERWGKAAGHRVVPQSSFGRLFQLSRFYVDAGGLLLRSE